MKRGIIFIAALAILGSFSSIAGAEVAIKVRPTDVEPNVTNYEIFVTGDAAENHILLAISEGVLKVEGVDPPGGPVSFGDVAELVVNGGSGNDTIDLRGMAGLAGHSALLEGGGISIGGNAGDDNLWGPTISREEADADLGRGLGIYVQMSGNRGMDRIHGSLDGDALYGGTGSDRLYGGDGMDMISGGPGKDRIWGGANGTFTANPNKQEQIYGNAGDDLIFGGSGNDEILGQDGEDRIYGGPGRDVMYQNTKSRRGRPECRREPPGYCNPIIG